MNTETAAYPITVHICLYIPDMLSTDDISLAPVSAEMVSQLSDQWLKG